MEIYSFAQLHTLREFYPPDPCSDPQGGCHILKVGIRKKIMLLVAQDSPNKLSGIKYFSSKGQPSNSIPLKQERPLELFIKNNLTYEIRS